MARQAKTQALIDLAHEILATTHPMTVRQVFYQLVSRQVIQNTKARYQAVSRLLVDARVQGDIPWEWIEDRLRRPRYVSMWKNLADFATVAEHYRRNVWQTQPSFFEVWLEKDALSGIFQDALAPYGVTLNVGRGYDGWDSIHNAAGRWGTGENVTVLYFGDHDPSGENMFVSLKKRLASQGSHPHMIKVTLTGPDIERYHLPPNRTKKSDSRQKAFVAKNGDVSVELDALPTDTLRAVLIEAVEQHMDMEALEETRGREAEEREWLLRAMNAIAEDSE